MSTTPHRPYPDSDLNVAGPNERTVELFAAGGCRRYAEIGVYRGYPAERIAQVLGSEGEIHPFDYADRVEPVAARLRAAGHRNVVAHGNSRRLLDSYNWSPMAVLAEHPEPVFDYVFIAMARIRGLMMRSPSCSPTASSSAAATSTSTTTAGRWRPRPR